ncbi:Class I SAM-dependent methyltransferase [Rhodovastum atsumiense]|nr:Class I SAM-dependent methyltransferase [Rhodovastum atsumiense]
MDFARRALGWNVLGLDPSPFAQAGRSMLALPIESRYLTADDASLQNRFDVVMASEVIEHVVSPLSFARTLWASLRDGGSLVLTTPDVDAVDPGTPAGLLVPLLSIGYHPVLQSQASLAALLRDAGFVDVAVRRTGGASLEARGRRGQAASAATVVDGDRLYRRYLDDVRAAIERDGDLWLGFTARAYREAVNAGDLPAADTIWKEFSAACSRRFGFDPDAGAAQARLPGGETLEALVKREPLCLGPVLAHRALHRLVAGAPRPAVEPVFMRAVAACQRLRMALQRIGTDDADAEDIAWVAQAEIILCAAARGARDVPERIEALGPSPADAQAARGGVHPRHALLRRRAFVGLVNAASLDEAGRLAGVVAEVEAHATTPGAILADDELDVLYCSAARELQVPKGSAARALDLLTLLDAACAAARQAGRTGGSAVTLVTPVREAKALALKVLGRTEEAERERAARQG